MGGRPYKPAEVGRIYEIVTTQIIGSTGEPRLPTLSEASTATGRGEAGLLGLCRKLRNTGPEWLDVSRRFEREYYGKNSGGH